MNPRLDTNSLDSAITNDWWELPPSDTACAAQPGWGTPLIGQGFYRVGPAKLLELCGPKAARHFEAAILLADPEAAKMYLGPGLNVGASQTRDLLDKLAGKGGFTVEMVEQLKALGQTTRWLFGAPVSAADVKASRLRVRGRRR
ncbi:MAG TPA: hypothetical protein VFC78_24290 [Tepidisphaeraceae bacterium]|nr:hypothetical protein [Tepidisphaeraceae bacterium]